MRRGHCAVRVWVYDMESWPRIAAKCDLSRPVQFESDRRNHRNSSDLGKCWSCWDSSVRWERHARAHPRAELAWSARTRNSLAVCLPARVFFTLCTGAAGRVFHPLSQCWTLAVRAPRLTQASHPHAHLCHTRNRQAMRDNPYQSQPPDFAKLAEVYPDTFGKHVKYAAGNKQAYINFHDAEAVRSLSRVLLLHDFGIHVEMPENKLCPPIPNRLNYILWIKRVLEATRSTSDGRSIVAFDAIKDKSVTDDDTTEGRPTKRLKRDSEEDGRGRTPRTLDIGTGAVAIYPLLGCVCAPQWDFVATDIDQTSLASAAGVLEDPQNSTVAKTHGQPVRLAERIKLVQRSPEDVLIPVDADADDLLFHATMCNPPFFSDAAEMDANLRLKSSPPNAVCSGSRGEMVTTGGEVAFVTRMIDESMRLRERVMWYTSLLGKLSSVPELLLILKERGIDNYGTTEFVQGQTRRWGIIWSFTKYRLPDALVHITHPTVAKLLPGATAISRDLPTSVYTSPSQAMGAFRNFLASLGAQGVGIKSLAGEDPSEHDGVAAPHQRYVRLATNVWNRAARRAAKAKQNQVGEAAQRDIQNGGDVDPVLGVIFSASMRKTADEESVGAVHEVMVTLQWTYGKSRVDFDSFASAALRAISRRSDGA